MIVEAIALSLVVAVVRGGRITRLGELPLRSAWLIFVPGVLIVLLYIKYIPGMEFVGKLAMVVHIAAYGMVLIMIWLNRSLPGMVLIGLGAAMNFAAIAANGGRMPVSVRAVEQVGLKQALEHSAMVRHVESRGDARLWCLSDILPARRPPFPFPAVISIGDIALSLGLFILIQRAAVLPKRRAAEASSGVDSR